jgi:hypothetical protein
MIPRTWWLTCPECEKPARLLCEVDDSDVPRVTLLAQYCECNDPYDAWPVVVEEAIDRRQEEKERCLRN